MLFYRVDTGYTHHPTLTVLDVVQFEEQELGNDNLYCMVDRQWLATVPARRCMWFTKSIKDALRYGSRRLVDEYDLDHYFIIGEDGDGGYLVIILE